MSARYSSDNSNLKLNIFSQSWDEYDELTENWIIKNGTAVQEHDYLSDSQLALGRWHRSKDKKQHSSTEFGSYMINKRWWLEEQFNVHMMRFQQVKYIYKSTVEHF